MTIYNEDQQNHIAQATFSEEFECQLKSLLEQIVGTEIKGKIQIVNLITSEETVLLQSTAGDCKKLKILDKEIEFCLRRDENNNCILREGKDIIDYLPSTIPHKISSYGNIHYRIAHENGKCTIRPAFKVLIGGVYRWIFGPTFLSA